MSDENQPLPAAVSEYTNDHPSATPSEVMGAVGLDEHRREQVEYHCAVTRYTLYGGDEGREISEGVRPATVGWSDVAELDVPESEDNQQ